jgi:hypothetical protein
MDAISNDDALTSDRDAHFIHSALRESIVEHVFIGEVLRCLWRLKIYEVEVLRSEVDSAGYDLVIGCQRTVRHIQLKTILSGGKADEVKVGLRLMDVPSGCVVWIVVTPDLGIESYLWFGGLPGEPLPDVRDGKIAKHTKGNAMGEKAERSNHRLVRRKRFQAVKSTPALIGLLFGDLTTVD